MPRTGQASDRRATLRTAKQRQREPRKHDDRDQQYAP